MKTLLVFSLITIANTLFSQISYKPVSLVTYYYQSNQYSLQKPYTDTLKYDPFIEVVRFRNKEYTPSGYNKRFIQSINPLTNELILVELVDEHNNYLIILALKHRNK